MAERNQPLTPMDRIFLQPKAYHIVNFAVAFEHPIDVVSFKTLIQNSIMLQHPRFCSLIVRDSCTGREHWRRTVVDIDRHLIVLHRPISAVDPSISDDQDAVNNYMADLPISSPLPIDKPLWEIHLLLAHKTAVFRVNHALGDGFSLMSMLQSFSSTTRKVHDQDAPPRRRWSGVWMLMKSFWYTVVFAFQFLMRLLWVWDETTCLSGGSGVELWPRRLATARFRLDDMKTVKRAVGQATINDVLVGAISCGFSRYLDTRSTKALKEGTQITGISMVNLRPRAGLQDISDVINGNYETWWGNKIGVILFPIYYHRSRNKDPLQFVRRTKTIMDKKKLSLEALFSNKLMEFGISFPVPKLLSTFYNRMLRNTTFFISNIVGPRDEITLAGNPVKTIRLTSSSLPQAIIMHMVSYAGMAEMQISVAKDIIPDPKVLANYFEDALLQMKQAAEAQDSNC
ncbi:hypothetical protein BUALT_Bualt18G0096400 [Buddleja alternifolia]|uniref:Diacylglycerol O-acyltransferase n=1 Tax=Buddleja alternifolia TaxID=168488 RepID=A0AAV6W5H9_9LAMI|nr:hypothetical protein BUALT_Bualt18G0096400 [Buddleja alternifolia]